MCHNPFCPLSDYYYIVSSTEAQSLLSSPAVAIDSGSDEFSLRESSWFNDKAGYTAGPVACGWVGPTFEVTRAFGQEQ